MNILTFAGREWSIVQYRHATELAPIRTRIRVYTYTNIAHNHHESHTCIFTYIHTHIYMHVHTHTHTHTHRRTHILTLAGHEWSIVQYRHATELTPISMPPLTL